MTSAGEEDEVAKFQEKLKNAKIEQARNIAEFENSSTMMETFEKFAASVEPLEDTTREKEALRFLLMHTLQQDINHKRLPEACMLQLKEAKKSAELEPFMVFPKTTSIGQCVESMKKGALEFIERTDKFLAEVKEKCRKVDLLPGEVDGNFIKPEAIERLRKENPNMYTVIEYDPNDTPEMKELRQKALNASWAIAEGMPIVDLDNGVNSESDENTKKLANAGVNAAAVALREYEMSRNVIKRQHTKSTVISVNYDAYLKSEAANNCILQDFRQVPWFNSDALRTAMALQTHKCTFTLALLPVMECAIFLPRLAQLLCNQPLPPVIDATRVYRIYIAALTLVELNLPLKTHKEFVVQIKRKMKKVARETGAEFNDNFEDFPQSAFGNEISKEMYEDDKEKLHAAAMRDWHSMTKNALENLMREKNYHTSEASRALTNATSSILPGTLQKCPYIIEQFYYASIWNATQHAFIGFLHKLEACLIKRLSSYINGASCAFWMTDRELPTAARESEITSMYVRDNNAALTKYRSEFIASISNVAEYQACIRKAGIEYDEKSVPLGEVSDIDDTIVFAPQPWSPTIAQMKKFVAHVQQLVDAPKEAQQIFYTIRPALSEENLKTVKRNE
jgi:hypothetical protein